MKTIKLFLLIFVCASRLSALALYSDDGCSAQSEVMFAAPVEYVWHQEVQEEIGELLFSFNALLPAQGYYYFYLRVRSGGWSDWQYIAAWGDSFRGTVVTENEFFSFASDTLTAKTPYDAFEVKVCTLHGASLRNIKHLYAATCIGLPQSTLQGAEQFKSVQLPCTPGYSQMVLDHPRHKDLCSPTSVTNVLAYLLNEPIAPLLVASIAHDDTADIYGNWMLNAAAAYAVSGGKCPCHVQRLSGFAEVIELLTLGRPVVVSIKGPLPGSATPYANGHLMMVYGYDAATQEVLCIDSAFPTDEGTRVRYKLNDFLQAWARRGNLAYVFS